MALAQSMKQEHAMEVLRGSAPVKEARAEMARRIDMPTLFETKR